MCSLNGGAADRLRSHTDVRARVVGLPPRPTADGAPQGVDAGGVGAGGA